MCQLEQIPRWLLNPSQETIKVKKNKLNFLRKTIRHLSNIFTNEIYISKNAQIKGLMQSINPKVKLIILISLIIITNFAHNWLVLVLLFIINISYVILSKLELRKFIIRVWAYIPITILIFSLPGLFNVLTPGNLIVQIIPAGCINTFAKGLYITSNGINLVAKLFIRNGINLGFAYLLILTTPWIYISRSLSQIKLLQSFTIIIDMCYRYLFLLATLAIQMIEARFTRSIGQIPHRENRRYVGHSVALLFIKSSYLAEEINWAMRLRGFKHKIVALKEFKVTISDLIFLINNLIIIAILFFLNRV